MKKILFLIILVSAPLTVFANGFGSETEGQGHMMTGSMMSGFMGFGWIFMILFWILVIVGIIAIVKWIIHPKKDKIEDSKSTLDIIKERYARGDIDKKEFEEKKKDLT